ncbi:acyl-CoA dehydrogenase N-terminal domain-containing protein [Pseudomonas sp. NPDC090755]
MSQYNAPLRDMQFVHVVLPCVTAVPEIDDQQF